MKAEYVQLAHTYKSGKHNLAGQFVSTKLDGQRAIWDGGTSRGAIADNVPYANTLLDKKETIATGLYSRGGKVIHAPDYWLDQLPIGLPLDGELWLGNGTFQTLEHIVRTQDDTTADDWKNVQYLVFDVPPPAALFSDRDIDINRGGRKLVFSIRGTYAWWAARALAKFQIDGTMPFHVRLSYFPTANGILKPHKQVRLPLCQKDAEVKFKKLMDAVICDGGEGLIIKSPANLWLPERTHGMLKAKPFSDMEATVVDYQTGRATDLGSKLRGLIGSLICKIDAGEFQLSGFTDVERKLSGEWHDLNDHITASQWAWEHPDCRCPAWITSEKFPRGSSITIKYRELSDDGIPKEAVHLRKA